MSGCDHVDAGRLLWTGCLFAKRVRHVICARCGARLTQSEPAEGTP